jgi:hypothetical protein
MSLSNTQSSQRLQLAGALGTMLRIDIEPSNDCLWHSVAVTVTWIYSCKGIIRNIKYYLNNQNLAAE